MIPFWKYHGAGNDFILVDQRHQKWLRRRGDEARIARWCDRHFGIGADGLILLQEHPSYHFEMVYFNADGSESTLCGNGGRCIVAFAYQRGIRADPYRFLAIDGPHEAHLQPLDQMGHFWVSLRMQDVKSIDIHGNGAGCEPAYVLDTGSPHYVRWVDALDQCDMIAEGRAIRYAEPFAREGINVNLVEEAAQGLRIRTYERGVEGETLACGTGVTAAALAWHTRNRLPPGTYELSVLAKGGTLSVCFTAQTHGYTNIWLRGPTVAVFSGEVSEAF